MKVEVLATTTSPDELASISARNDYYHGWVGGETFNQVMDSVSPHTGIETAHRTQLETLLETTTDTTDTVYDETRVEETLEKLLDAETIGEKQHVLEQFLDTLDADEAVFGYAMNQLEQDTNEAKERTLLTHLMKHGHYGPFEHPSITISLKGVSRSCMAQLTRHRLVSFDVQSMRYVNFEDIEPEDVAAGEWVVVPPSATDPEWIGRNQKTGSVDSETVAKREEIFRNSIKESFEDYRKLIDLGMPPEDARYVLPIGWKTNIVMSLNARHLMHIADMRAAADAQWEIRGMTEEILAAAEDWAPLTFELYDKHLRNRKNRLAP